MRTFVTSNKKQLKTYSNMKKQRKQCNNKVEFHACGKSVIFRLSDSELKQLRRNSIYTKGQDWEKFTHGSMYNFSAYAYFDYEVKGSKRGRFIENFPYLKFDTIFWFLL